MQKQKKNRIINCLKNIIKKTKQKSSTNYVKYVHIFFNIKYKLL